MSSSTTTPPNAEDIVASPAVDGDLNAEMRRAAKPFSRTTVVLAGLVVLAVAFGGGVWTHAAFGSSAPSTPTRQAGGAQGGQQAGAGQQGGGFRGGRGTTGTVDRVDGTTVYVKTAQGTDVKVSTSDSTTIGVTQQGQLSDLKPGATVVVQGQAGSDGTVTAQAITQEAAR
ncbi:hypothetical protein [Amycolatopsis sp. MtRt-6]|uniref:hypothetical protein n=1 Tax=Amycolatopsis sp. MtRt-6 TaxID=2792782 RepID=UPI001A8C69E8|nr:hypothetical protein [Amycolatopsis sp. MtRt-6]